MKKLVLLFTALGMLGSFSASATLINFNDYTINPYGGLQDGAGTSVVSGDGSSLTLTGNKWKSISESFAITTDSLLKFDFYSGKEGEVIGIGFSPSSSGTAIDTYRTFQLAGVDLFGYQGYNTYNVGGGWVSFTISVGAFYTGIFERMFFIMDDDSGATTSNASFRNVEICEAGACLSDSGTTDVSAPEPSALALFGLGLIGLFGLRRKI